MKGQPYEEKIMICAFLARVIHGKHLGTSLQSQAEIMPLSCTPF